jgi:uncharacterized LabA/DUF88 family protein
MKDLRYFFSNICVFIDNSNLLNVLKESTGSKKEGRGIVIDYGKLLDFIEVELEKVFRRDLTVESVFLYDGKPTNNEVSAVKKDGFISSVKGRVESRNVEFHYDLFPIELGKEMHIKGVDTSIVLDIYSKALLRSIDIVVLIAGDGDFVPVVKRVQEELRLPVIIAFFDGYGMNKDLKGESCYFIPLELEKIGM